MVYVVDIFLISKPVIPFILKALIAFHVNYCNTCFVDLDFTIFPLSSKVPQYALSRVILSFPR